MIGRTDRKIDILQEELGGSASAFIIEDWWGPDEEIMSSVTEVLSD